MYPIEKNLGLLFERFNKSEDGSIIFEEFVSGITPFLSGIKQNEWQTFDILSLIQFWNLYMEFEKV